MVEYSSFRTIPKCYILLTNVGLKRRSIHMYISSYTRQQTPVFNRYNVLLTALYPFNKWVSRVTWRTDKIHPMFIHHFPGKKYQCLEGKRWLNESNLQKKCSGGSAVHTCSLFDKRFHEQPVIFCLFRISLN